MRAPNKKPLMENKKLKVTPIYLTDKHRERSQKAMKAIEKMDRSKLTMEDMLEQLKRTTP